jgi:hypothetical protein
MNCRGGWKMTRTAYTFEADVGPGGKLKVSEPLSEGTRVAVLILAPEEKEFDDLVAASASSTDFWDNPLDDEDWNHA